MAKTNSTLPAKDIALSLLNDALTCGIRGANKTAIQNAIDLISDDGKDGLSPLACKKLKVGKTIKDSKCKGLRLQANKSGKVWVLRVSVKGKSQEIRFGLYPDTSLAEARDMVKEVRDRIKEGKPPALDSDSGSDMTVETFCDKYIKLAKTHKRSWKEDERQINRDILPLWEGKLACDITADDCAQLVENALKRGSPRSAEKLKQLGRFMFNVATAKGKGRKWLAEDGTQVKPWFSMNNPFDHIVLPEREISYCVLKGKTLKSYLQEFDSASFSDDVKNVLKLHLLCNTRISEPAQMVWSEVDLDSAVWTIPAERTKTNVEHDVMLSTQAVELLESLADEPQDSDYVFAFDGMRRDNISTHIAEAIKKNRKTLGVPENFTTHSLRHTGQTLLASMRCPVEVRDRIANHKPNEKTDMSARYNSHEYDEPAREWLQKMADQFDALTAPNVVELGARNAD